MIDAVQAPNMLFSHSHNYYNLTDDSVLGFTFISMPFAVRITTPTFLATLKSGSSAMSYLRYNRHITCSGIRRDCLIEFNTVYILAQDDTKTPTM